MKTETINKLCTSYMEDARALKRNFPNRELVLCLIENAYRAGIEDAYKGIKPFNWAVTKYGMSAATLVGLFVIRPFLKGGFELDYNGETVCTPPTLSKAKKIANKLYKRKVKEKFGL